MSLTSVLAVAVVAVTSQSTVGTGPFHVPASHGRRPTSRGAHLVFDKPATWPRETGSEDQPSLGTFHHDITLPRGGICTLTLYAAAEAMRRRPVLAGRTVHSESGVIRARVHGKHGTTLWVSGAVSDGSDAARAVRPLSARFAPP